MNGYYESIEAVYTAVHAGRITFLSECRPKIRESIKNDARFVVDADTGKITLKAA